MVQWLGFWTLIAKQPGSVPGRRTKNHTCHVAKKKKTTNRLIKPFYRTHKALPVLPLETTQEQASKASLSETMRATRGVTRRMNLRRSDGQGSMLSTRDKAKSDYKCNSTYNTKRSQKKMT